MAAITLLDLERTESLLLFVAELLDNTPGPLHNDDAYTSRTEAIADYMKCYGGEISAALNCTSVKRADKLAHALANAHRDISWACASLEYEYKQERCSVPQPYCLLWHACCVLRVLEHARDAACA